MEHQAHGVDIALEAGVDDGASLLGGMSALVEDGLALGIQLDAIAEVEVEVALGDRGGEDFAVAGVDVAATCGVGTETCLALSAAGTPLVAMHPLDAGHGGEDGNPAAESQQQVKGGHALGHPHIPLMFFFFHCSLFTFQSRRADRW